MKEMEILQDITEVKISTPYKRLREMRGLSQEQAAEIFNVSSRTILDVENGKRDASKQLVRAMDKFYGCKGALIAYWLPKFSFRSGDPPTKTETRKKPRSVWQCLGAWVKLLMA